MKKYDNYKDSGIEWIGEIPEHWIITKVKFAFSTKKGKTPKVLLDSKKENSNVYLSMDYLRGEPKQTFYVSSDESVVFTEENETLLLWDGSNAGEFVKSKKGILSSTMALVQSEFINKTFQWFFFKSFESLLKDSCNGMGIPHVDGKIFRGSEFLIPPAGEQAAIANYLDHKTTQIDTLIAKKQQFISLLQEERTAVINQAVTKGLDSKVKMKDSGIDWLGEIPEHWEVKKLKYVANLKSGNNIISEQITPNGIYPVYGGNGLRGYFLEYTNEGDFVLIGRQGALCGNINYAEGRFWASEHAVVCYLNPRNEMIWLGELLRIMNLNQYSQASAQPGLAVEKIKNLSIPVPSEIEQKAIVEHFFKEQNRIDIIIATTQQEIELLKEYKTALISEVVTGKVDVRDVVLN